MAKLARTTQRVAKKEPVFPKKQILNAVEFLGDRDVLNALLEDGKDYSKADAREILDKFNRKVVG